MKQTLSKWTQLHSSGGGKSRLLHLALMLICMLATAQAGGAQTNVTVGRSYTLTTASTKPTTYTITSATNATVTQYDGTVTKASGTQTIYTGATSYSSQPKDICYRNYFNSNHVTSKNTAVYAGFKLAIEDGYKLSVNTIDVSVGTTGNFSYQIEIVNESGTSLYTSDTYTMTNYNKASVTNGNVSPKPSDLALSGIVYARLYFWCADNSKYIVPTNFSINGNLSTTTPASSAPTLTGASSSPAASATNVAVSGTGYLKFSKNLSSVTAANITISPNSNGETLSSIDIDGTDASKVNYSWSGLQKGRTYTINVAADAVSDGTDGNAATSLSFTTVAKAAAGLAYNTATVNKNVGDASFTNPLTNPNNLSGVTYSITNNGTGSSISTTTGEVTVGSSAGKETITARFAGNDDYNEGTATYELTVQEAASTPAAAPTVSMAKTSYDGATITNVGTNYSITNTAPKDIKFYVIAQPGTFVRFTMGESPADPTTSTTDIVDATSSSSAVKSANSYKVSDADANSVYYIKAIAYSDAAGNNPSSVVTFTFTTTKSGSSTPTVSFSSPITTVEVGKKVTNEATLSGATGSITYSSSDAAIASVNSSTGEVTGEAAGKATITAIYTENSTNYTASYEITVTDAPTPSAGQTWDFTEMSTADKDAYDAATSYWKASASGNGYYDNKFTTSGSNTYATYTTTDITQIKDLKFFGGSSSIAANNFRIHRNSSGNTDGYLEFRSGSKAIELPTLATGTKITVFYNGGGSSKGFNLTNAKTESGATRITGSTDASVELTVTSGSAKVRFESTTSGVKLYKIVASSAVTVKDPTVTPVTDANFSTSPKSVTFETNETEGKTYYVVKATRETNAATIAAGTEASEGTNNVDVSTFVTSESNAVISAVTKKGDEYSNIVYVDLTYNGKHSFLVKAADKTLQVGGRDNVDPYITYLDGTRFEIGDDDTNKLSDYFTFTYERTYGADADVLVASDGVINIPGTATPGNTATIKITATPTELGKTLFNSGSQTGTMTVTVKAKEEGLKMSFYWDPECTEAYQVQATEWENLEGEGSRSVFKGTYENGRMIYVKPDPGYEIWVATVSSETPDKGDLATPTASIGKYDDTHYSTTHGIPLYISGMSNGQERTLVIGLKAYKAGTTEGVGSAVSARFRIVQTADGQEKRPDAPTFSPANSATLTLSTAQTVAAVGAPNSYVFSKFGSKTLGLGYFINYLEGTQAGREQVATFSTEIGPRDIKALQITGSGKEYYISKYGSVNDYKYNLASKLLVTPASYYVNINETFTAPVLTKITTDQAEEPSASNYSSPTLTGYFYNKQKAEANAAPYQGLTFEKPAGTSLLSYELHNFNGAHASINETTGEVTIGDQSGYAIVTVKYAGGEEYTIDTKKVDKTNTTTSPMTATYRINIVDPNEYLPIITPSTRKFANNIDVTISAPDENHFVKYVVAKGEAVKTKEEIAASGETINKSSRSTINVGADIDENEKVTVYAIAYGDDGVPSNVVKETYTKVKPLQKPTLSPDGVTKPYEYTGNELAVAAVAYNAGAIIYYTTDGSDPTKDGAKTYDGASKILVEKEDGTTIVKAAAYLDGIYSDVVTGTYVHTDNLAKPWFLVNNEKVEGTEKIISTADVITISSDHSTSTYYYTLDGTAPTTTEGQAYKEGFKLVKTVTASAIATENGLISPATTVKFIINDEGKTKHSFWEAIDETTPNGKMAADDRKVYVTNHTDNKGTSSYIYVDNLAATFGGFDNNAWNKASIGEKTQGAAIDGVGTYSIRNTMDVKEETDSDYDPTNMQIESVHGRTHALPSQGAYVKFEPEKDGVLTIWALQQGGLHYNSDGDFCSRFIRFRPVFMVDETGKSIKATTAESTACLSENWSEVEPDNWLPRNAGNQNQNGEKNLYYDDDQNDAIYNMYTSWMTAQSISDGGSIKPFEAPKEIYPTLFTTGSQNAADYADVHGYVMPSGGNVKYTFPVKAGKTYFFFGFRTKLGIRGFNFVPTTTDLGETVTLPQDADAATVISNNNNQTKNVKLVRNVKKNIWTTFCLPFSVSQTQLENTFGEGTQVMQFVNVKGYTMNVFKHYHHMIVAGTPILVKPTKDDMTEFTFYGVHIQNVPTEEICDEGGDYDYKFVGGYTPMTVTNGSYYIGNKDGLWHKLNNTNGSTLNGSRAYLQLVSGGNARALTLNIASFNGEDDDTTTGIAAIESNGNDLDGVYDNTNKFDGNIYNLQGQLVRKHAKNLNGLAKGVYIINGKKVVIND